MGRLGQDDRIDRPDDLYQLVVDAHQGLSPAESRQLDASLVLLLANHIGDIQVVAEAVAAALAAVTGRGASGAGETDG